MDGYDQLVLQDMLRSRASGSVRRAKARGGCRTAVLMPISVKMLFSALEEIRTPNLLIRSNHAYCDVLNEICAGSQRSRSSGRSTITPPNHTLVL
jgi:hypothetical protein